MEHRELTKWAAIDGLGTVAYITLVVSILNKAPEFVGEPNSILVPILFLTLFVVSAATTGSLVLGRPLFLFMSGDRSGCIRLFLYTLAFSCLP